MADKHSAADSYLGYLYQGRYALLRALLESRQHPTRSVSIEKFDDVAFQDGGDPIELIQLKHHGTPGEITDFSVDLWRTLSIWMDRIEADPNSASETRCILLTTASAAEGSVLACLREHSEDRDEVAALSKLISAAESSTNKTTKASREKFLALTEPQRVLLVSMIWVFDNAPNIIDVRTEIEELLHYSASGHAGTLVAYLEGWWFNRIVLALTGEAENSIPLASIEQMVFEISDGFKVGALPLDNAIETTAPPSGFGDDRVFTKQLGFIAVSNTTRTAAIRDFYRAYSQRSRWVRESLLLDEEAEKYDRTLQEAWAHEYAAICEDVDGTDEPTKCQKGRDLLRWANRYIRPLRGRDEPWISSGTFQMLSDVKKVGWHPDYQSKLDESKGE